MTSQRPSPHHKALQINVDATVHGTFAEIGAGQEAVRWFFRVGGAASTVAKTTRIIKERALFGYRPSPAPS